MEKETDNLKTAKALREEVDDLIISRRKYNDELLRIMINTLISKEMEKGINSCKISEEFFNIHIDKRLVPSSMDSLLIELQDKGYNVQFRWEFIKEHWYSKKKKNRFLLVSWD